jgi:hypothetical protein
VLFIVALEYTIRKVQENQAGLKLNAYIILQFLSGDEILLGSNTNNLSRTEAVTDNSKEMCLKANTDQTDVSSIECRAKS